MKTHEIARALMLLARMLKDEPNVELKDWPGPPNRRKGGSDAADKPGSNGTSTADAGLALGVLLGLSRYSKGEWRVLISEWGLPVEIRRSDSVRDLVGRLLNYLEDHPDVAQRIKDDSTKKSTKASPELLKVLSILLGKDKGEGKQEDKDKEKER